MLENGAVKQQFEKFGNYITVILKYPKR